jgi:hypothetical protein
MTLDGSYSPSRNATAGHLSMSTPPRADGKELALLV